MMGEKRKSQDKKLNALLFLVFWVLVMGISSYALEAHYFTFFNFVTNTLPEFLARRAWIFFLILGLSHGLVFGLAQKLAIRLLSQSKLEYWLRLSIASSLLLNIAYYLLWRYLGDSNLYSLLYSPAMATNFAVLGILQWRILRKHFGQAWLWLLLIIPNSILEFLRYDLVLHPAFLDAFQAFLAACVLLWINQQALSPEKLKNSEEAEARLADTLLDESENQELLARYQASDA
jgi:hypothetical protein